MKFQKSKFSRVLRRSALVVPGILIGLLTSSCGQSGSSGNSSQNGSTATSSGKSGNFSFLGAGSTFVYPLYSKMFNVYNDSTGIRINYQSIGSGGGIRQLVNRTVDFGASDAPMSDEEMSGAPGNIVHIPVVLGAVAVTYNLPGNPILKFTGPVIADIYLGNIRKWNDPKIQQLNPDVKLPDMPIAVVHRSDGSGTSYVWTDYLSKVSKEWKSSVGMGKSVAWPVGLGGKGNEGAAGLIKQTRGAFGYVELAYATETGMPTALIQNKSGNFEKPTIDNTSTAGDVQLPPDARVSITNTDASEGYPISSFTYVLLYKQMQYGNNTADKAHALVKLVWWMIHPGGQKYAKPLQYAPLPASAVKLDEKLLESIKYGTQPVLTAADTTAQAAS